MDHFLEYLFRPTFLLSVILVAAVANLWRKRRETRWRLFWVTAPLVLLAVISMPWAADLARGALVVVLAARQPGRGPART